MNKVIEIFKWITYPLQVILGFLVDWIQVNAEFIKGKIEGVLLRREVKKIVGEIDLEPVGTLTNVEVKEIVARDTGIDVWRITNYDQQYWLYKRESIEKFLSKDTTDKLKYVAERRDCDNFMKILTGAIFLTFPGIAWADEIVTLPNGGGHALNGCIFEDKKYWDIESQNDNIFNGKDKQYKYHGVEF